MELKHARTSADYSRIEQLGLEMADLARQQRVSAMTDFPAMSACWHHVELGAQRQGYNVFRAWRDVDIKARMLRMHLHWLTANNLDTTGDAYAEVAVRDAQELREKNAAYGESWKRRGGAGAFMMLARKWDRLDNILAPTNGGSHMSLLKKNPGDVLDDIGDLRRYLLLVEDEVLRLEDLPHYGHSTLPVFGFHYVNHKGEHHTYLVRPLELQHGSEHYPKQWVLRAEVLQRDNEVRSGERCFALGKLNVVPQPMGSGGGNAG